jgi:hypothetical protein
MMIVSGAEQYGVEVEVQGSLEKKKKGGWINFDRQRAWPF